MNLADLSIHVWTVPVVAVALTQIANDGAAPAAVGRLSIANTTRSPTEKVIPTAHGCSVRR